jgi:CheY-like chemotaxis protein
LEDEYDIANEIAAVLADAGAEVLGPVPTVPRALRMASAPGRLDAALLDVNLRGEAVWPVVDVLRARGVPMVLTTGYDPSAIPPAYARLPRREKPVTGRDLVRSLVCELGLQPPSAV